MVMLMSPGGEDTASHYLFDSPFMAVQLVRMSHGLMPTRCVSMERDASVKHIPLGQCPFKT